MKKKSKGGFRYDLLSVTAVYSGAQLNPKEVGIAIPTFQSLTQIVRVS